MGHRRVGVCALLIALVAAAPARAAWLPVAPIDAGAGAGRVTSASLAVLPSGGSLAAWLQESCSATDLACRRAACPPADATCQASSDPAVLPNPIRIYASVLQSGTWSAPQPLAVGSGDVTGPATALASDGNGAVVFVQGDAQHQALWAARVAGGTFQPTTRVDTDATGNVAGAGIAADSAGRLTVVWAQYRGGRKRALARRFQSGAWGAATLVDTGAGAGNLEGLPQVAARDGAALVAWAQGTAEGRARMFGARFDGSAWAAPAALDDGAGLGNADTPLVALVSAAQGVVAFRQRTGLGSGQMGAYASRLVAGGFAAAERMDVGTGTDDVQQMALAADPTSGGALLAWSQRDAARRKIYARRLAADAWGLPANIDASVTGGGDAFSPSVALRAGGDGIAAWYAYDPATLGHRIKSASLVGGAWTAAIDVGPASGVPLVGTTDSGDNIAVWFFNDGTRDRIGSAPDDRTPPSIELDPITTLSGQDTTLQAAVLGDALSGVEHVTWTFGDGTPDSTDLTPVHRWSTPGSYSVSLTATDRAGNTATVRTTATVDDGQPPTVDAGPDRIAYTGVPISFVGTATDTDSGIDATSVRWSLVTTAQTWPGLSLTTTFAVPGTFTLRLDAADGAGNLASDTVSVTVRDRGSDRTPPVVDAGADVAIALGAPLTLEGTATDAESGVDDATVRWVIDDGATYPGTSTVHRFTSRGDHVVTLQATDMAGNSASDQRVVHVGADTAPPEIDPGPAQTVEVGATVTLTGTVRDDGSGIAPGSLWWELPNGIQKAGLTTTTSFATPGARTVRLHAADTLGNAATAATTVLVVPVGGDHLAPVVAAGPDLHAWRGLPVELAGTADDGGGIGVDAASVRWLVGDTPIASGLRATATFAAVGATTVTLEARDLVGNRATDELVVQVDADAKAPTLGIAAATITGFPGKAVQLTAHPADADSGLDPASLRWSFDDGTHTDAATATRTYAAVGAYRATFVARDRVGNRATATVTVRVGAETTSVGPRIRTAKGVTSFAGDRVTLTATVTRGTAALKRVLWTFPDRKRLVGARVRRVFATAGRRRVRVTATDARGISSSATTLVTVRRLTLALGRVGRVRGRLVVRARANAPGTLRVTVQLGKRRYAARAVRVRAGRVVAVALPKAAARLRGRVRVTVALARPQGGKATLRRVVRLR